MADVYGVTPTDIAGELPAIFVGSSPASSTLTPTQLADFITQADLSITIAILNASGAEPSSSDRVAPLAKRYIIDRVKAQVIRIVYTGNAPADVDAAAKPYEMAARDALASITALETQAAGAGEPAAHVRSSSTTPTRDLIICDSDLDRSSRGRF